MKRPIFLYSVLAVLFAVTLAYQVRYLPAFVRREGTQFPSLFVTAGSDRIAFATPEAAGFGVHNGDQLLAVNGEPYIGTAQLGHAFATARPGVPILVTIVPQGETSPRSISLPVTSARFTTWDSAADLVVGFLLPAVSLLLGFWVALRRPRDPMAWLLLGLMMSFPHVLQSFVVEGWPSGWRSVGALYEQLLQGAFPILSFLFGRFFPEPFPHHS